MYEFILLKLDFKICICPGVFQLSFDLKLITWVVRILLFHCVEAGSIVLAMILVFHCIEAGRDINSNMFKKPSTKKKKFPHKVNLLFLCYLPFYPWRCHPSLRNLHCIWFKPSNRALPPVDYSHTLFWIALNNFPQISPTLSEKQVG